MSRRDPLRVRDYLELDASWQIAKLRTPSL
jgi:hypothetical protein